MKSTEKVRFFSAFGNDKAKALVRSMMISHYSEAVKAHYPGPMVGSGEEIKNKTLRLCDQIFRSIEALEGDPEGLVPLMKRLSRHHKPKADMWFEEFDRAYEHYKHHGKMKIRVKQLRPYFRGRAYGDIGCGGGDMVAFIQENTRAFSTYAGIDVMDWRTGSIKEKINFQLLDFSRPGAQSKEKYDTLTCLAVLHHVGNTDDARMTFLKNLKSAMVPDSRLIIEEDVILPREEWEDNDEVKRQMEKIIARHPHYKTFVNLSRNDQHDVLIIIDLLSNALSVGVPEMPFPFGFKSLEEWRTLFRHSGYTLETIKILGFQKNTFNRSSHVLFVLCPEADGLR